MSSSMDMVGRREWEEEVEWEEVVGERGGKKEVLRETSASGSESIESSRASMERDDDRGMLTVDSERKEGERVREWEESA